MNPGHEQVGAWLGRLLGPETLATTGPLPRPGTVMIDVPRDRAGTFSPVVVPKHARRLEGFDEQVLSLYAKGMTTGDIVRFLEDVYDTQVSKDLVHRVADQVLTDMRDWQARPLGAVYPVVLIDAIVLKVRAGQVANRPVYVAMASPSTGSVTCSGCGAGPPVATRARSSG